MTRTGTTISRRKFVAGAGAVGAVGAMAPRLAFGTPGNTGRGTCWCRSSSGAAWTG